MSPKFGASSAVASSVPARADRPKVVYRIVGDSYLLVEYGEMVLDLHLRFRVYALCNALEGEKIAGVLEMSPGVRSVLLTYDPLVLDLKRLIEILRRLEEELPNAQSMEIPSRIIRLPLAFHDRWTIDAIQRYITSIRAEAPYLPDNVEFVARCNGFDSPESILDALTDGYKMVLGLGDVYLGAPCAVPLNPLTRVVVPKYNPARTFSPEGAVGIGGSYICIYPMESPGGYQLVGRTIPIWNTYQTTSYFKETPWLLRNFDRIGFFAVEEAELEEARAAMLNDRYELAVEDGVFDVNAYDRELEAKSGEIEALKKTQRKAAELATKGY